MAPVKMAQNRETQRWNRSIRSIRLEQVSTRFAGIPSEAPQIEGPAKALPQSPPRTAGPQRPWPAFTQPFGQPLRDGMNRLGIPHKRNHQLDGQQKRVIPAFFGKPNPFDLDFLAFGKGLCAPNHRLWEGEQSLKT